MSFRTQRRGTERSEKSGPFEAICPSTLKISGKASFATCLVEMTSDWVIHESFGFILFLV